MLRALLFDLGNVLVGLEFDRAYRAAAACSPYTVDELRGRFTHLDIARPYETGEVTSQAFYERCRRDLSLDVDYTAFAQLWGNMFADEPLIEREWLDALAEEYRLVLVSNTNELHYEWIRERYEIVKPFHAAVLSYEVGAMKPDPKIYEAAVKAAGCRPEECFFTDDKAENIDGARKAGIQAEVFSGATPLRETLRTLGVAAA